MSGRGGLFGAAGSSDAVRTQRNGAPIDLWDVNRVDISSLPWWAWPATATAVAVVLFARYALLTGLFEYFFKTGRWAGRFAGRRLRLSPKPRRGDQTWRELRMSFWTSFVFGVSALAMAWVWQAGYLKVYLAWRAYPLWWLPVSLTVGMLLHETYYYWLHRWMHHPRVYPWLHRGHHDSVVTSGWTSFAFDVSEAWLQALIVPVILLVVPMHGAVLVLWLTLMTVSAIVNHLNVELYPLPLERTWWGRNVIGATHHGLHHTRFTKNYGLYFTFWDRWCGTEVWK